MGCNSSNDIEKQINFNAKRLHQVQRKIHKLLLLGAGSSGKSTLFRQLKCIHGWGFEKNDEEDCTFHTRENLVKSMVTLLGRCSSLYEENPMKYSGLKLDFEDKKIINNIQKVLMFKDESFQAPERLKITEVEECGKAIEELWKLPQLKECYTYRYNKFAIVENINYFFEKASEVFNKNYKPKHEDVLLTRIRTTAIVERTFELKESQFKLVDVGGQRNERKKWIHQFSDVTALIFVAALNHYNTVLFEDENKNSMHESIELFRDATNNKWFKASEVIIFFNKDDLFRKRLLDEVTLSVCFTSDYGWEGKQWKSNYGGPLKINSSETNEYFTPNHLVGNEDLLGKINQYENLTNDEDIDLNNYLNKNSEKNNYTITTINEENDELNENELNIKNNQNQNPKPQKRQTLLLKQLTAIKEEMKKDESLSNVTVDQQYKFFEHCHKEALDFIKERYIEVVPLNKRNISSHITTATDRENIEKVFWDVQDIIVRSNLRNGGFVY